MINRLLLVAALAIPSSFGALPWDKAPEKWDRSDAYRILQDSPWSPAQVKLDTRSTTHYTDSQTGRVDDFSLNRDQTNPVSGVIPRVVGEFAARGVKVDPNIFKRVGRA